jgi:hypothetical protein
MKSRLVAVCLGAVAASWANLASAAIITYTDRTVWTNDMASIDFTVDFESFAADTSFAAAPLDVGPFTISTIGTAAAGRNIVDVAPFLFPGVPVSFGNAAADFFVEGSLAADIVFDTPVTGFFADFLFAGNTQQLTLTLTNGGTTDILVPGPGSSLEPFGFISTSGAITSIRLNNSVNDGFYIDNVSGGQAAPEPTTFILMGLGLAAVGLSRSRKG